MNKAKPYSDKILNDHGPQRTFSGSDLLQIALPIGGLGAGNVCLNGHGGLQDFAIRNQPATTAMPDAHARCLDGANLRHCFPSKPQAHPAHPQSHF